MAKLLRFLSRYARRYAYLYALGIICLLATNSIAVWIPREIERGINRLQDAHAGLPYESLTAPVVTIFILGALLVLIRTLSRILFFIPGRAIERDLRNDLFRWYVSRPIHWFESQKTGDLISRSSYDVLAVRALVGYGFLQLSNMVILLVLIVAQMITLSATVTLFAILPLALGMIILRVAIKKLFTLSYEAQERLASMEQRVLEGLKGVRVVRDFGANALVAHGFDEQNDALLKLRIRIARITSFYLPCVRLAGHLAIGTLLIFAATLAQHLTVGEIAAYIAYLTMLVALLFSTGWMLNSFQRGMISLNRIDSVMPMSEVSGLDKNQGQSGTKRAQNGFSLHVNDVDFEREGRLVLNKINLSAEPGQQIGILGTVASGKSTLARILAGLEIHEHGQVILRHSQAQANADEDIVAETRLVPDVPFLFTRSILENVAFDDKPESVDEDRAKEALEIACFDPLDEGLKDGIHTLVGEKGIALSGGQKQRITLARAIYSNPDVLILDDVLSAVDHQTERTMLSRLAKWREGPGKQCIIINISNRVSALTSADQIFVLHQGEIVERGTPSALKNSDGLYARTLQLQSVDQGTGEDKESAH